MPGNWYAGRATTDAAGAYRFPSVAPGTYTLQFKLPGGLIQFHPGVPDLASAGSINVLTGQDTNVAETVMPHGTIGGRITTDTGAPAPGARVELYGATDLSMRIRVIADAAGDYLIKYPPTGRSRLAVASGLRGGTNQWVHRQKDYNLADRFTVTPGRHTVVDERLLPAGLITGRFHRRWAPGPQRHRLRLFPVHHPGVGLRLDRRRRRLPAPPVARLLQAQVHRAVRDRPGPVGRRRRVRGHHETDRAGRRAERRAGRGGTADRDALRRPARGERRPDQAGRGVHHRPSHDRAIVQTTLNDGHWFKKVWPGTYTVRFNDGWGTQVQWATAQETPQTARPDHGRGRR